MSVRLGMFPSSVLVPKRRTSFGFRRRVALVAIECLALPLEAMSDKCAQTPATSLARTATADAGADKLYKLMRGLTYSRGRAAGARLPATLLRDASRSPRMFQDVLAAT